MVSISLPLIWSSGPWSSWWWSPTLMNIDVLRFSTKYPDAWYTWFSFVPWQVSLVSPALAVWTTYWITDFPAIETIAWTPINQYNRKISWEFLNFGNYYDPQTFANSWWVIQAKRAINHRWAVSKMWFVFNGAKQDWTFSAKACFVSLEKLVAWKSVWSVVELMPAIDLLFWIWNSTLVWSNVIATYTIWLISTSGTKTTIWTYSTPAYTSASLVDQSDITLSVLFWLQTLSFTPIISWAWDRLFVDVEIAWTYTRTVWLTTPWTSQALVNFGYNWSALEQLSSSDAARPIQISVV